MRFLAAFLIVLAGLVKAACATGLPPASDPLAVVTGVETFLKQDPVALAKGVIESGGIKFLAIAGFTVETPGIDSKRCLAARQYVHVIPGTSDMLENKQQFALQAKAKHSAGRYNRVIRTHLTKQGLLKSFMDCPPPSVD